jgi:NTP pyrophosphatase (non-canonical NTP hydrolase)
MNPDEYQAAASATAVYPSQGEGWPGLAYASLGLAGEAGEVANKVKKIARDDGGTVTEQRLDQLVGELGGVAWYLAQTCTELNLSLEFVLEMNISKLRSRHERGVIHGDGDDR